MIMHRAMTGFISPVLFIFTGIYTYVAAVTACRAFQFTINMHMPLWAAATTLTAGYFICIQITKLV